MKLVFQICKNWRAVFASISSLFICLFCKPEYKLSDSEFCEISSWIVVYFSAIKVERHWSIMKCPLSAQDTALPFRICYREFSLHILPNTSLKPMFFLIVPMAPSRFITVWNVTNVTMIFLITEFPVFCMTVEAFQNSD